jgi:hypothetical protein
MDDLLQKAAEDFAANWCHDYLCNCEVVINSAGRVVSHSKSSGESIVRIATDVWVFRNAENSYTVAHYTETHEIEENELLNDPGPVYFPASLPSDLIDERYEEFDLMSTDSKVFSEVPFKALDEAARLLAEAFEDDGFEDFFQERCEWKYKLPPLHPTIRRKLKKKCHEHSKKIKAEAEELEKISLTFDLEVDLEKVVVVRSGEPVVWIDSPPRNLAIFHIKIGRGAGEMRRAIRFRNWLQEQRESGFMVTTAQGIWQGFPTKGLDVIFGVSKDEVQRQRIAADMDCALYIRGSDIPERV